MSSLSVVLGDVISQVLLVRCGLMLTSFKEITSFVICHKSILVNIQGAYALFMKCLNKKCLYMKLPIEC